MIPLFLCIAALTIPLALLAVLTAPSLRTGLIRLGVFVSPWALTACAFFGTGAIADYNSQPGDSDTGTGFGLVGIILVGSIASVFVNLLTAGGIAAWELIRKRNQIVAK